MGVSMADLPEVLREGSQQSRAESLTWIKCTCLLEKETRAGSID
jgi:hypothetical protein